MPGPTVRSNPGLFGMSALAEPGKFEAARDAMLAEIERMKREPVSPEELIKAVKQFTAATLSTRKTMQDRRRTSAATGWRQSDLNFSERYLERGEARATAADRSASQRNTLLRTIEHSMRSCPPGTAPKATVAIDELVDHPVRKFELPNGLRLLVKEDHRLPFVQLRAVFKGGVLAESVSNNGVTLLMAKMLLKGTSARTAEQIVTQIESLGGTIDSHGGNNSFGVHVEVLSGDFPCRTGDFIRSHPQAGLSRA